MAVASGTRTSMRRDRAVRAYVRQELYPHAVGARERLNAARILAGRVRSAAELSSVEPVALGDVGDGSRHVLRPTRDDLLRSANPFMRARTAWASTWGRWDAFMRRLEPAYRPVHFFVAEGVPVGAATGDLIRLAGFGAAWMRSLGLTSSDVVALVHGAKQDVEAWELSGGTRRAGVPLLICPPLDAATHRATAIAGTRDEVKQALAKGAWPELRLAIVFSSDTPDLGDVAVRRAWAPPGTRSAWFECRGGASFGLHTTPGDLVQVADDGEALWTGVGWAGTVFLRLRTGVLVDRIDDSPCPSCGHREPRVFLAPGHPGLARFLRDDSRVADYRLTPTGAHVLPVRAGANVRLLTEVAKTFPGHKVAIKTKKAWSV